MNITATQLKQQTHILSHLNAEDIIVTKRDKPFAVIIAYDKYQEMLTQNQQQAIEKKIQALQLIEAINLGGKDYQSIKSEMA
ncbi:MAG: hypothetical protein KU28_06320 [Sulfurovum sp. PC08-66]|jgi:antitoxin (DNA-binding transcriptional repressor) of toxin-antitoxin stability system|nr:MAG: hypothetical protein KU28_06320 [Sulfurovum sp. PC08-66]